jgi:YVTN family beta-propeller protein
VPISSSNSVVATITVGSYPQQISFDKKNKEMYVANFGSDTVSVIDSSNTVVASISVGSAPESVIFDSAKGNKGRST